MSSFINYVLEKLSYEKWNEMKWLEVLYRHLQHHNDTIINTQEDFLNKIYVPLTLFVRVRKGYSRFTCERELETEHNCNILTSTLMAVNVVSFSFSRATQPEALGSHCWVMAFFTASYQQLLWFPNSIGVPEPLRPGVALMSQIYLMINVTSHRRETDSYQLLWTMSSLSQLKYPFSTTNIKRTLFTNIANCIIYIFVYIYIYIKLATVVEGD